ncbi:MAG: HAD family phosphatase [Pseudomonadota bacterium]
MTPPFAGALFDMDGLLLDTERLGQSAFVECVAGYGIARSAASGTYLELVGTSAATTRAVLADLLPNRSIQDVIADWHHRLDTMMADGVPLRPGVAAMLARLAARAVPMAVVTSTATARAEAHLSQAGIRSQFLAVIGGDAVPALKPDPAPYRLGAAALGLPPAACAAFEDSDTGTRAAVAAGCAVWQVPDLRPAGRPVPDLGQSVVPTLLDAIAEAGF